MVERDPPTGMQLERQESLANAKGSARQALYIYIKFAHSVIQ